MGLFNFQKNKRDLVAIFDIGSGSVGGALVLMPKHDSNAKIEIIKTERISISFQKDFKFDRFFNLMLKALEETAGKLSKAHLGAPKETHFFLASPWHYDEIRHIKLSKSVPFVFTKKIWHEMLEKELENFKKEKNDRLKISGIDKIIENKNMEIKLNGYRANKPDNKKVLDVEIAMFLSCAPSDMLDKIEEKTHQYIGGRKSFFHSFNFSSFVSLRGLFFDFPNFLFIDIAGEITDISLVKNEILTDSITFPFGKNFLVRRVAEDLRKTPEEAESIIFLWQEDKLDGPIKDSIEKVIISAGKEWLKHFQDSLMSLSSYLLIPEKIIITVDNDVAKFFSTLISKEEFSQHTLSEKRFDITVLQANHLSKWFTADNENDPFIMVESIFINNLSTK